MIYSSFLRSFFDIKSTFAVNIRILYFITIREHYLTSKYKINGQCDYVSINTNLLEYD
jgi:hypothetical protein